MSRKLLTNFNLLESVHTTVAAVVCTMELNMKHLFNIFKRKTVVNTIENESKAIADDRKEYLNFCESEAKSIYRKLSIEVLDELETSGKAYIHAVGRYDNIFKHQVANMVKKMFEKQNIKLNLFNSIRWIEAVNK